MPEVRINGARFALARPIDPYIPKVKSEGFSPAGGQRRIDNIKVQKLAHRDWSGGMGWESTRRDSGRGANGFWDSDALTIHRNVFTQGILQETQTTPSEDAAFGSDQGHLKKYTLFKGDLWGLFESDYNASGIEETFARKFGASSDDWTSGGTVSGQGGAMSNDAGQRAFDMVPHKGSLFALVSGENNGTGAGDEVVYKVYSSADGATWADASGTGWPDSTSTNRYLSTTVTRRNNFNDDMGRLLSFGNTLMAAIYEDPASTDGSVSQVRIYYSTDSGSNWTAGATIPSGDGPKAFISGPDPTSTGNPSTPLLFTAEGFYRVDSGGTTFDLILAFDGAAANGRWAVFGDDGALWAPMATGQILRYALVGQNTKDINFVYPPDGLPSARQGVAHMLTTATVGFLLVAYGGSAASKNAAVYAIDYVPQIDPETGRRYWPWHSMYKEATANVDLYAVAYSTEDDDTPRLHMTVEGTSGSEMLHIERPFTNPMAGVTQKFQTQFDHELPLDDLGDPHSTSGVFTARILAENLGDKDSEYVEMEYGVDGAVATNVSDVGFFVTADPVLFFGKTDQNTSGSEAGDPDGVEAKTIRINLKGVRDAGDNTDFVAVREFQIEQRVKQSDLFGAVVTIDIAATRQLRSGRQTARSIINELITIKDSAKTVKFQADDSYGTKYVEVVDMPAELQFATASPADNLNANIGGTFVLAVEEVVKTG